MAELVNNLTTQSRTWYSQAEDVFRRSWEDQLMYGESSIRVSNRSSSGVTLEYVNPRATVTNGSTPNLLIMDEAGLGYMPSTITTTNTLTNNQVIQMYGTGGGLESQITDTTGLWNQLSRDNTRQYTTLTQETIRNFMQDLDIVSEQSRDFVAYGGEGFMRAFDEAMRTEAGLSNTCYYRDRKNRRITCKHTDDFTSFEITVDLDGRFRTKKFKVINQGSKEMYNYVLFLAENNHWRKVENMNWI